MKKFFLYSFKQRRFTILLISICLCLISLVTLMNASFVYDSRVVDFSPLPLFTGFAGLLATIVPIYEFNFKMNKITIDQLYSLPVKKEKIFLSKFFVGLLEIIIPFTINILFSLLIIVCKENIFHLVYLIPYYFCMLIAITLLYSIFSFVFTRANTIADGIINILFSIFLVVTISGTLSMMIDSLYIINFPIPYLLLNIPSDYFNRLFCNELGYKLSNEITFFFILFIVIAIGSFILFILLNKKEKSENAMQISDSYFSYKTMIPTYIFCLSCICGEMKDASIVPVILVFSFIFGYLLYALYLRNIKVKPKYIGILAICIIVGCFIGVIF